jgi:hypothetical protein
MKRKLVEMTKRDGEVTHEGKPWNFPFSGPPPWVSKGFAREDEPVNYKFEAELGALIVSH